MNKRIKSKHLQPAEKLKQPALKKPAMIRSDFSLMHSLLTYPRFFL